MDSGNDAATDGGPRRFEPRRHRRRRLYWRVMLPAMATLVTGAVLGRFEAGALAAITGLLLVHIALLRDMLDRLGFIASLAQEECGARQRLAEHVRDSQARPPE